MRVSLSTIPKPGQLVRVRTRHWIVEEIQPSGNGTWIRLACVEDDAQGDISEVIWDAELDARIVDAEAWNKIGEKGFDDPRRFAAYFHTLRWHCVTATRAELFQAPFRAGIRIDAYQLEPLRKALLLPRVNLFIADDVGLGKTIEAGLITTELLLRRRVREVVVTCPPSMLKQWQDELDSRFGLRFEILDREYVERIRRERGYAVNPWDTFPRFLISQRLLIDESHAAPMRVWLGNLRPGSLLILDEAHHAAPSSGGKYAIDSKITRAIRDVAERFEHRLFLSATPHNGHSNSFSALLELLDNKRFMRGVKVRKKDIEAVMVRRLKSDVRTIAGGFPSRCVVPVEITAKPDTVSELRLADLLNEYAEIRRDRFASSTKREQTQSALILSTLQQRLFSSIEAFHRTLGAHRRAMERAWGAGKSAGSTAHRPTLASDDINSLTAGFDGDDERSQLLPNQKEPEAAEQMESEAADAFAAFTESTIFDTASSSSIAAQERTLLDEMARLAEQYRYKPDARIAHLVDWLRKNACPGIRLPGPNSETPSAMATKWSDLRVIIFTEYEDTARYLRQQLTAAIAGTDQAESRIETFHGPTSPEKREALKRAFNEPPARHPLRILIATDAAREGLNLQAHCWNLFHFDLPWNPSRLEQRNGRIDRKLQPADEVFCHYFIYKHRPEDRVLSALMRKTETIRNELGSLSEVIVKTLRNGIRRSEIDATAAKITDLADDSEKQAARNDELEEAAEKRQSDLRAEIEILRNRINTARQWIGLDEEQLRETLNRSLELLGAAPLQPQPTLTPKGEPIRYAFPNLQIRKGMDARWSSTLDTLRPPRDAGQAVLKWRGEAPLRPVVFSPPTGVDAGTVQLHLSHRVVHRLLGRFLSQGFVYHDLSRACLAQSDDAIPRVVLLGRLALYGAGAVRLHEELISVTARWMDPADRKKPLTPYERDGKADDRAFSILQNSLKKAGTSTLSSVVTGRLQKSMPHDIQELLPHLEQRGGVLQTEAAELLTKRGRIESEALCTTLQEQRQRVLREYQKAGSEAGQIFFAGINDDERKQLAADRRHWKRWLETVDEDIAREPRRIAEFYQIKTHRIEPIGLAYLWPVTG
ncbi:MAG: DISARM system SNF2-like helicase DrmD [Opitutaceae bacterium]|jgi:superfamily II DNA or RNA helicase|nr:DISARM system SNF2-like helicase DrmD [Opitutaceae bacterium]